MGQREADVGERGSWEGERLRSSKQKAQSNLDWVKILRNFNPKNTLLYLKPLIINFLVLSASLHIDDGDIK